MKNVFDSMQDSSQNALVIKNLDSVCKRSLKKLDQDTISDMFQGYGSTMTERYQTYEMIHF